MANASGFGIVFDTLGPLLFASTEDLEGKVVSTLQDLAAEIQDYAQSNAPWTDQTGDARAGLTTEVESGGGEVILSLFHTVEYGQWLETIQSGRFAIIMPTLEEYKDRIFSAVSAEERTG